MQSIDNNFFISEGFHISTQSVFVFHQHGIGLTPIVTAKFVVDNAGDKTVDNEGNYWVA